MTTSDNKDYQSFLAATFENIAEADYTALMEHYQLTSTGTNDSGLLLFDWGQLKVTPDNGSIYYSPSTKPKYIKALKSSITYVVMEDNLLCGYERCRDDGGFGIYILDLLVKKQYRGRQFGRCLIERITTLFPDDTVYVTSDADPYYEKLGCEKEGTVFKVVLN